jgi:ribosome-binding protein aMBF1 (putative translation factor)
MGELAQRSEDLGPAYPNLGMRSARKERGLSHEQLTKQIGYQKYAISW